ncbi:MAG: pre-16S rRNA-processing nuclease YqgF [Selenomonas sp.]|nr:pre-16S rRNA-processing nuclease YqgF [Selenomonas sp.]
MAVDPGRDKCGLAVLDREGQILWRRVIPTAELVTWAARLKADYQAARLILGTGTTHSQAEQRLREALPEMAVEVVDEYRTTELAKKLYWKVNPPRGWRRLLPLGLQVPPEPVDDLVAVILARRALGREEDEYA